MLSPRLAEIYSRCLPELPLWDLCCDHGHLGLWGLHTKRHSLVVFNDAVLHLLENLPPKFGSQAENAKIVHGRAEDISEPLTGSVVLAGIGGEKIDLILRSHLQRGTLKAKRIVVCPEKDADWLLEQTYEGYRTVERKQIPHNHGTRWVVSYEAI